MAKHFFTRTGDEGMTSLTHGKRVRKDDDLVEAYGTMDELNSHVGLLAAMPGLSGDWGKKLQHLQDLLYSAGGTLADPTAENWDEGKKEIPVIEADITYFESLITRPDNFILPGGSLLAAQAHVCRTVCRRAERRVCALPHEKSVPQVLCFLNRLSDFFFALALSLNKKA